MTNEWSNTRLTDLLSCGERFRRKHLEGEATPSTLPQTRGSVVHAVAAQANLRQYESVKQGIHLDKPMPAEEAGEMASSLFDEQVEVSYQPRQGEPPLAVARGAAKDLSIRLAQHYVTRVAPQLVPIAVERRVEVRPKDSDLIVHGQFDLITVEMQTVLGQEEPKLIEVIRDLKTGTRSPRGDAVHQSQQLTFYGMLRRAEVGTIPGRFVLDHLIRTPHAKQQTWIPLSTTRSEADIAAVVQRLNAAVQAVKAGVFLPAAPGSWRCSRAWCEFWHSCKYVNHNEVEGEE